MRSSRFWLFGLFFVVYVACLGYLSDQNSPLYDWLMWASIIVIVCIPTSNRGRKGRK